MLDQDLPPKLSASVCITLWPALMTDYDFPAKMAHLIHPTVGFRKGLEEMPYSGSILMMKEGKGYD